MLEGQLELLDLALSTEALNAPADGLPVRVTSARVGRLRFTISNEYVRRDGTPQWRYPWLERNQLIEPHRLSEMAVDAPRSDSTYTWELAGRSYHGERVDVIVTHVRAAAIFSINHVRSGVSGVFGR